jgi:hypothetical protein
MAILLPMPFTQTESHHQYLILLRGQSTLRDKEEEEKRVKTQTDLERCKLGMEREPLSERQLAPHQPGGSNKPRHCHYHEQR